MTVLNLADWESKARDTRHERVIAEQRAARIERLARNLWFEDISPALKRRFVLACADFKSVEGTRTRSEASLDRAEVYLRRALEHIQSTRADIERERAK